MLKGESVCATMWKLRFIRVLSSALVERLQGGQLSLFFSSLSALLTMEIIYTGVNMQSANKEHIVVVVGKQST